MASLSNKFASSSRPSRLVFRPLLLIALRNVIRNRKRSFLTLMAIVISVLLVVVVRATLNGLQTMIKEKVVLGQVGALQIHKAGFVKNVKKSPFSFAFRVDEALLTRIRAVPGVVAVTPRLTFPTMVSAGDKTVFALGFGLSPQSEYEVCPRRRDEALAGQTMSNSSGLLSPEIKKQLGVNMGQSLTLLTADGDGALNAVDMGVGGFLADGLAFTGDKKALLVPLETAQTLLRLPNQAFELALRIQSYEAPEAIKAELERRLGPEFEVHTWRELAQFILEAISNQNVFAGIVVSVFMIVSLISVSNTMLMSVLERTREIGTMMAVGVRRYQILLLFLCEAVILGTLGAVIGATLAYGFIAALQVKGIAFSLISATVQETLFPWISPQFIGGIVLFTSLGALLAALYPAWRASRLKPVEALAHV